jgi:hypothetical protein
MQNRAADTIILDTLGRLFADGQGHPMPALIAARAPPRA